MGIKTTTAAHIKISSRPKAGAITDAFSQLKAMILGYKPSLRIQANTPSHFEVWTTKEISIHGKKLRKGVMFACLVRLNHCVGLYFQPLYFNPMLLDESFEDLLPLKAGLTSFHYTILNDKLELQTKMLLEKGLESYKVNQWL